MGAATRIDIHGAKGGESSPKQPTEAADSLRSTNLAKILIAVGEGEFDGTPTARDIYLDNTPIADASGNINFPNVKWEWRPGSVDQSYIPGIPSVENETTVNVELRSDNAWVRSLTNTQLSAVRVRLAWPALQRQDDEGNLGGYRIDYAVDVATDGGAYQVMLNDTVDGKSTTRYERSRRIDLPKATSGWQLRIRRLTPNQNTNKIADTMLVAGYTEVIDEKLRYPNTALLYVEFDAEQFTNIPAVTVDCNGRKWQVPSNYDPVARTYSGIWDGTFKQAWTNNPAWATYGICTQDRFGLGKRIKPWMVNKWELYRIAQYCDQLVDNGVGGLEPRFLCDFNLQGKTDAWSLLRDISAIYRGMTYWAQGQLVMQADMPRAQDFDYVFTRANVIDGKFQYGSASAKTRYTRALVSYDNPANNYDTDVIAYADTALQRRLGDKPTEISAIGCTRASEAQRRAKWVVLSNSLDRTVSFKTGMEGRIPLPGFIIPIADSLLAGREIGGRISSSTARVVTLDRDTQAKAGDRLIINLPSGKAEGRTVQSVRGRAVTVTADYSELPVAQLQWALDADDLAIPLYRVLKVRRTTEGDYEISALQYEPSKFAAIDSGARLEERPISVIPVTTVQPPASVTLTSHSAIDQGIAINTMTIEWPAVSGAVAYDVEWRKDNGNWVKVQRTGATSVDVTGIYAGAYLARVRAVSAFDISSIWRSSMLTNLTGKVGLPPAVTSITTESLLFGIGVHWTFPPGAEDTQRTELWYSQGTDVTAATKLSDLAYPQSDYVLQNLRAGAAFFFWARLVDRTGNVGPFYPAGVGVRGESSSDASAILDQIAGQVGESSLGKELAAEIELISGDGPASVNERLQEAKSLLAEQIAAVDTELEGVKTELQGQIDAIADLADSMPYKPDQTYAVGQGVLGTDGVIYQAIKAVPVNMPPPNSTYWLNVGQAVATANGLAARVQTVETKVTWVEGVNTSQAQQITGLRTDVDGKASASSVQSIGNRVTNAENSITSQGSAITGLNNSLTTTNTNVSAAQTAANNAAALAGSKGKVLVQSAAPAVADQLAQNLWIDITGGANTPKRWNGSIWAPVTDKVATDAASAAASALTQVQTKADAGAVAALTNRVTATEGAVTSASNNIVSLTNSLSLAGGENLLFNPSFDKLVEGSTTTPDGWAFSVPAGPAWSSTSVPSTLDFTARAQRIEVSGMNISTYVDITPQIPKRPAVPGGQVVTLSTSVRGTPGLGFQLFMQHRNAAGAVLATTSQNITVLSEAWQRVPLTSDPLPAGTTSSTPLLRVRPNAAGTITAGFAEIDNAQFEIGAQMTGWRDNSKVLASDQLATSGAVSSLSSTVAQQGAAITSASNNIVSLTNNLGMSGGENLLYNPDFVRVGAGNVAEGWIAERPAAPGSSTAVWSMVTSFMNSGEMAQRMTVTGLNISSLYRSIRTATDRLARIAGGQGFVTSAYVRGTANLGFRIFVQQLNAAQQVLTTTNTIMYYLTDAPQRIALATPNPATGAVYAHVYLRVYGSEAVSDGFIDIARPQLEYGNVATGWRNNGQVAAATQSATSTALDSLTSVVGQQGTSISSVSGRTTLLENAVNSTTNGLGTKASASAVETLANRVTASEGVNTSQSSSITDLNNSVSAIQGSLGASGLDAAEGGAWHFDSNAEGWSASNSTLSFPSPGVMRQTATAGDPSMQIAGLALNGGLYTKIRVSITRRAGTATSDWDGRIFYATSGHGFTASYSKVLANPNLAIGASMVVEFDMAALTAGGADWTSNTITALRIDLGISNAGVFDIDWVVVGRLAPAASSRALSALTSTVTQQGSTLTAQAAQFTGLSAKVGNVETVLNNETNARASGDQALGQRVDTVQASLGDTRASVQQTSTALAGLNGQVNAQYSVKVMTMYNGMKVAAGFGLGLESEGGITQSTFAVSADRFVVLNANLNAGAQLTSPFAVVDGQVFINDAFIRKATIQNAIVGSTLTSAAVTSQGVPKLIMNMSEGRITFNQTTRENTYTTMNADGIDVVVLGVRRVRMGVW